MMHQRIYEKWKWFAHKIGTVNAYVILTFFYLLVVGSYWFFFSIFSIFTRKQSGSLWKPYKNQTLTVEQARRFF